MKKIITISLVLNVIFAFNAKAAIVFEDNFDSSPDWQSAESYPSTNVTFLSSWKDNPNGATQPAPDKFTSYRSAIPFWSYPEHTYVLGTEGARGGTGKGMTYNLDPVPPTLQNAGWSGGGLDLYLGASGYQELYTRIWLKFDPNTFHFRTGGNSPDNGGKEELMKVVRISRVNAIPSLSTGNIQSWVPTSQGGLQGPTFFPDLGNNAAPGYNSPPDLYAKHLAPSGLSWPNDGGNYTDPTVEAGSASGEKYYLQYPIDDGQWHMYEFRVKMNSAPGVADGEWEVWVDGLTDRGHHTTWKQIPWVQSGSTSVGWNWIILLDNAYLWPNTQYQQTIEKIFMDDVDIYSPLTSSDPLWASSPQDGRLPLNYAIGSAAPATTYANTDFATLVSNWLKTGTSSDLNSDSTVNTQDIGIMMSKWN